MNHRFRALEELGEQFERAAHLPAAGRARARVWRPRLSKRNAPGGLRTRRGAALALLAGLVVCAGAAAAVVTWTGGSTAPVLAGQQPLCPEGFDYLADTAAKVVYPPNYPGRLPRGTHTTCFASGQAARHAGYSFAPVPHGYSTLGSLYIEHAPVRVRTLCDKAARVTHHLVYCPTRLPASWSRSPELPECPASGCTRMLTLAGAFATRGVAESDSGTGYVGLWAAPFSQQAHNPYLVGGCWRGYGAHRQPAPPPLSRTSFRGHPAAWYRCDVPMLGTGPRDIVFQWRIGDWTYGVAAGGAPGLSRRLVAYIAAHLAAVEPPQH